jgi:hypothetical protein
MENTKEDKKKFAEIMWGLAEEGGGTLSTENLKMRFRALSEYSIDQVSMACDWLFKNREATYPQIPRTKEIIDAIKLSEGELVNPKTIAQTQCDIVFKYFNHYGSECDHVFKDPITRYLMGHRWSFRKLGLMNVDDQKWFRKEFVEAYQDYSGEGESVQGLLEGPVNGISAKRLNLLVSTKRIEE